MRIMPAGTARINFILSAFALILVSGCTNQPPVVGGDDANDAANPGNVTADGNVVLFEKNASWGPCPSREPSACTDNYTLYYSGRVVDNGAEKLLPEENTKRVLDKIKRGGLDSAECYTAAGTDYFPNYRMNVEGKEFDSSKIITTPDSFGAPWLSEKCVDAYAEIERIIKQDSIPVLQDIK